MGPIYGSVDDDDIDEIMAARKQNVQATPTPIKEQQMTAHSIEQLSAAIEELKSTIITRQDLLENTQKEIVRLVLSSTQEVHNGFEKLCRDVNTNGIAQGNRQEQFFNYLDGINNQLAHIQSALMAMQGHSMGNQYRPRQGFNFNGNSGLNTGGGYYGNANGQHTANHPGFNQDGMPSYRNQDAGSWSTRFDYSAIQRMRLSMHRIKPQLDWQQSADRIWMLNENHLRIAGNRHEEFIKHFRKDGCVNPCAFTEESDDELTFGWGTTRKKKLDSYDSNFRKFFDRLRAFENRDISANEFHDTTFRLAMKYYETAVKVRSDMIFCRDRQDFVFFMPVPGSNLTYCSQADMGLVALEMQYVAVHISTKTHEQLTDYNFEQEIEGIFGTWASKPNTNRSSHVVGMGKISDLVGSSTSDETPNFNDKLNAFEFENPMHFNAKHIDDNFIKINHVMLRRVTVIHIPMAKTQY